MHLLIPSMRSCRLGSCLAKCVQSQKTQPMSAVAITSCEGPGISCWFLDRSNCSHWSLSLTFTLTSENLSLCTTILLLLVFIQLRCWPLDSNYCRTRWRQSQLRFVLSPLPLHPRLLATANSDIPLFTLTWPAKHSRNQGWEVTQVTPLPSWVVSFTPSSIEH